MKTRVACMLLILWATIACTPTMSNKAQDLLDGATSHYSKGQYAIAKQLIDSIHAQFPKNIVMRKQAQALMHRIEAQEVTRNLAYFDSVIPLVKAQWDSAVTHFVMLDTLYQTEKLYKHKTLHQQQPATGLYCEVNTQGQLYLVSVYTGRVLDHTHVTVLCQDVYAQTLPVATNNVYNNRFTDLGIRWEYVTFDQHNQNNVLGFIATYANQPLKVTLHGKRDYTYTLPAKTANAIAQSVWFAQQTALLHQLKQSQKLSTDKRIWLQQKIQASDSLLVL